MRSRLPVLLLGLALAATILPAAQADGETSSGPSGTSSSAPTSSDQEQAQAEPGPAEPGADGNATAGPDPSEPGEGAPDGETPPANASEPPAILGPVVAEHVHFYVAAGGILDYVVDGRLVIASVAYKPDFMGTSLREAGGAIEVDGRGGAFYAVDSPEGHFRAEARGGAIAVQLAEGLLAAAPAARQDQLDGRFAILGPSGLVGHLTGRDLKLDDNGTLLTGSAARLLLVVPEAKSERPAEVAQAVKEGLIGGQVTVQQQGDAIRAAPITTGRLNMTVSASEGHIFATVDGHGAGTALLFTLAHGVLTGEVLVRFDGALIGRAADLGDVLDARADEPAEFLVLVGANATEVLVSVPHFSIHVIELASASAIDLVPAIRGSPVAFAVAAAATVLLVGAASWARSRQR